MWAALDEVVDHWVPLSLDLPRALPAADMAAELAAAGVSRVEAPAASVAQGLDRARELAGASGRVVVFGSFHTVAAAATEGPAFLAEAAATATRPVERVCTAEVSP